MRQLSMAHVQLTGSSSSRPRAVVLGRRTTTSRPTGVAPTWLSTTVLPSVQRSVMNSFATGTPSTTASSATRLVSSSTPTLPMWLLRLRRPSVLLSLSLGLATRTGARSSSAMALHRTMSSASRVVVRRRSSIPRCPTLTRRVSHWPLTSTV